MITASLSPSRCLESGPEIRSIANLASDYWMREPANDLRPLEAKISAGIRLIEELRVATAKYAPELTSEMRSGFLAIFP
jgi:hypothetical protein